MKKVKIIGITGLAGSGKSSIVNYLKNKFKDKIFVIDMDKIGHIILDLPEIQQKLIQIFSDKIVKNNKIDRKILGNIVFSNKSELEKLNKIVHPAMKDYIKNLIKNNMKFYDIILIDGALLFSLQINEYCDYTIFIDADKEILLNRLINFRKVDKVKAENILKNQAHLLKYRKNASFIIENNNNLAEAFRNINKFFVDFITKNN